MTTPIERPNGTDSGKNLLAQILLLLTGMAVHTLGIALITRADLGTTPISTLPLTLSAVMGVTLGTSTFIINIAFFLSQIAMLGSRFERRQWLQLPSVLLFSAMIDAWMAVLSRVPRRGCRCALERLAPGERLIAADILLRASPTPHPPRDRRRRACRSIVTGRCVPDHQDRQRRGLRHRGRRGRPRLSRKSLRNRRGHARLRLCRGLAHQAPEARAHARRTALRTCPSGPACLKGSTKRRPASRM